MKENDDGVGGIGDIDDSGLDNAVKADAEDKSNEYDNAASSQEAGAGTSVSAGQQKINVKTEMTGNVVPKTVLMSPTKQSMETQASPQLPSQQQEQV